MKTILRQHLESRCDLKRYLQSSPPSRIDFSTNDYLKLSCLDIPITQPYGASGSRLLSGNYKIFDSFERRIAQDKKQENALLFSSGYLANLVTLSTLIDKLQPVIFFDRLNHASLYDALRLSGVRAHRYKDMNHLQNLLSKYAGSKNFIVTETIFGMSGRVFDKEELLRLTRQYEALLYLDEAHATAVLGQEGYGLSTDADLSDLSCVIMGTFSKGLGSSGAYVACSSLVKDLLINFGRGCIYTTAPSPAVMERNYALWQILPSFAQERAYLQDLGQFARKVLEPFHTGESSAHILSLRVDSSKKALEIQEKLLQKGISVSCVRPPSVPSSILRMGLTTAHTKEDILELKEQREEIA